MCKITHFWAEQGEINHARTRDTAFEGANPTEHVTFLLL
jgi:hypothetical protein